jgi:hypothetical protein
MAKTNPYDEPEGTAHHGKKINTDPYAKKHTKHTKKGLIPDLLNSIKRSVNNACKQTHEAMFGEEKKKKPR